MGAVSKVTTTPVGMPFEVKFVLLNNCLNVNITASRAGFWDTASVVTTRTLATSQHVRAEGSVTSQVLISEAVGS